MMTRKYEPPQCSYSVEGPRFRTDGSVHYKVSGTMIGGIRGVSPWSSPFTVACDILGLGRLDVSDKPAVKTGKVLESKIIEYLGEAYPDMGIFIPAEGLYDAREGPHNTWKPDFDDETFTGHIDGAVMDSEGNSYILEVKTSSNLGAWMDGIPQYYYWQVALYNAFLAHQDKAYVALGIVDDETHKNPDAWVPSKSNVILMEVPIDMEEAEQVFSEVREWYHELVMTNTTPIYDSTKRFDTELYSHLVTLATDEDSMRSVIDEVSVIEKQISERMADLQQLQLQKDILRGALKDYLTSHDITELTSESGDYYAVVGKQTKRQISADLLRKDGIDPTPYIETKTTNTFTIKKKKGDDENGIQGN